MKYIFSIDVKAPWTVVCNRIDNLQNTKENHNSGKPINTNIKALLRVIFCMILIDVGIRLNLKTLN